MTPKPATSAAHLLKVMLNCVIVLLKLVYLKIYFNFEKINFKKHFQKNVLERFEYLNPRQKYDKRNRIVELSLNIA
jgi:hypothetical protein